MYPRLPICYLSHRVIDIAQGTIAKLIDTAAVLLLWRVACGRATEQERQVAALFPTQLHIPAHVHLPARQPGTVNSIAGTWSRDNLLDYLAAGPGAVRAGAPAGAAAWVAAIGTEAAFPAALPEMVWHTREPGRADAFACADPEIFEPDAAFLPRTAAWYRREGLREGVDDRERENALSAARTAELWLDSVRGQAVERLDGFELELRLRRIGMAGGDRFAQRLGWAHTLIGVDAVRAFNRHLAPWAAAGLMPEPFRLGLLDRGIMHPGLCAVLLAASAAAPQLEQAAEERATAPRSLPLRGVRYAGPAGGDPPPDLALHRLIKSAHGVPVFSPMGGNPDGLWEMFIGVRLERVMRPALFRQPSPLALRRVMDSLASIVLRVGPAHEANGAEGSHLEAIFLSETTTAAEIDRQAAATGGSAARALRALWRARR